jgi:hypothetical protein
MAAWHAADASMESASLRTAVNACTPRWSLPRDCRWIVATRGHDAGVFDGWREEASRKIIDGFAAQHSNSFSCKQLALTPVMGVVLRLTEYAAIAHDTVPGCRLTLCIIAQRKQVGHLSWYNVEERADCRECGYPASWYRTRDGVNVRLDAGVCGGWWHRWRGC